MCLICSCPPQDYCQALAKALGCCGYWNDTEKVAAGVAAGAAAIGIGVLVGAALYSLFTGDKTKENKN